MSESQISWFFFMASFLVATLAHGQASSGTDPAADNQASESSPPIDAAAPKLDLPARTAAPGSALIVSPPNPLQANTQQLRAVSQSEAVASALKNNPTLRVAELDVKGAKQQVRAEQGRYPYYLSAGAGYTHSTSTQLRADDTLSSSSSEAVDAGLGVRRLFPTGTLAEVRADGQYFHLNGQSAAFGVTPFAASGYGATFRGSLSQPLLRGYGTELGEADLRAARISQKMSERGLERVRSALIGDLLSAYFELWYASRVVDIEAASLALAGEELERARERLSMGAISKVDLLTFQTRASELEEAVVSAELSRKQRSVTLSQLMGQTPLATDLFASTAPELMGQVPDQSTVESAMRADSVELAELEQQVELARTRAEVAGEVWRPRLDLEAWVTSTGASTEFSNAWARAARGQYWSAHAGAIFDVPLDGTARHAEQMQAQLAVQSAQQQLAAAQRRVGSDATQAIAGERAARQRLVSAEHTTEIAARAYEAERQRYDLGQTIVIAVQEAEAALRRARLREARARVDAAQARLVLSHLTGQLLTP